MRRLLLLVVAASLAFGSAACRSMRAEDDNSDQAVKARIESLLRGRRDLDLKFVTLDVNGGEVTISGIVPNGDQLRIIRRLAAGVKGVDHVMNNLIVQE